MPTFFGRKTVLEGELERKIGELEKDNSRLKAELGQLNHEIGLGGKIALDTQRGSELKKVFSLYGHLQHAAMTYSHYEMHERNELSGIVPFLIEYSYRHLVVGVVLGDEKTKVALMYNLRALTKGLESNNRGFRNASEYIEKNFGNVHLDPNSVLSQIGLDRDYWAEVYSTMLQKLRELPRGCDLYRFYFVRTNGSLNWIG